MKKQFSALNIETFAAQTLATLTLYYVFYPLEKFVKSPNFVHQDT